jgi:hypothetical protein
MASLMLTNWWDCGPLKSILKLVLTHTWAPDSSFIPFLMDNFFDQGADAPQDADTLQSADDPQGVHAPIGADAP